MRYLLFYIFIVLSFSNTSYKKVANSEEVGCILPAIVPFQPYADPIWHPQGQLLGFNYTPMASIVEFGKPPCTYFFYGAKPDSTGFYLMNKNGTGFRRITNYKLLAPAWSPDGNWLAFSKGIHIYKMRYDGVNFDTANLIQLTTSGRNFFPCWSLNSDTIFYDSNRDAPAGTSFYSIWKMSADGVGHTRLTQSAGIGDTRQPHVAPDTKIYYTGYVDEKQQIFFMNADGSGKTQFSNIGPNRDVKNPKYYQGKVYYHGLEVGVVTFGGISSTVISPADTYDISSSGEIVYSKIDYSITKFNKQLGTLWIINTDGSNNHQLTFNNF